MIRLRECLMAVHGPIGTYATIANRCQISPSEDFLGKQPLDAMFFESALGTPHEKVQCFLMRMIGFSARALARGDYRQALKMLAEKENMDKAMVAQAERSISTSLQCSKCGQRKVTYTEAQTRSADEPMTLFCTCLNCGKSWKQ